MEKVKLNADVRMKEEKIKELREAKAVPWVVYWPDQESISIKVDNSDVLRAYRKAWESTIIELKVWKKNLDVVFHSVQREPITWEFQHIDFYAVSKWKKMSAHIALNFIWESAAKKDWAILEELTKEIEVHCLPANLVEHFDVDLSLLKVVGDSIKVSELWIDTSKYDIINSLNDVVVVASESRASKADEEEESAETESEKAEEK